MRVSVRDTGAGLTPEQLAQLFEPFNRLGREAGSRGGHRHRPGGHQAPDRVDGRFHRRGEHGRIGSVFWIELEGLTADARVNRARRGTALERSPLAARRHPPRTLLYVEDNPANLELVEESHRAPPDLRLLSAIDGRRASRSRAPTSTGSDPDGHQPARHQRARSHDDPARGPGHAHPGHRDQRQCHARDIERALAAGFFRYLTKPIKVNDHGALDAALIWLALRKTPQGEVNGAKMMSFRADILDAHILIVDDQEANVDLLEQMLHGGRLLQVASTMRSAEVCALHRKNRYDLILLDLQMPGMDGFQVIEGLKTNEPTPTCRCW
jgi:CheY-like chemotaxis protein